MTEQRSENTASYWLGFQDEFGPDSSVELPLILEASPELSSVLQVHNVGFELGDLSDSF
jgi:hypothetical protein